MTSGNSAPKCQSIRWLIDQLTETINRIDRNDLDELAKMHHWCQALAEACSADNTSESRRMPEQAASLLEALESLILGEVEDESLALTAIADSVAELTGTLETTPGDALLPADETQDTRANEEADEDSVEAKLAKIFDEEPPKEERSDVEAETTASDACACSDSPISDTSTSDTSTSDTPTSDTPSSDTSADEEPSYEQAPLTLDEKEIDFLKGFVEEAAEHIEAVEAAVLEVERAPEDAGTINDLFRPFHTIKGMAGFLNLRDVNCLTHEVETVLDQGRKGQRAITPGLIDVVFDVVDILKVQVSSVGEWTANPQSGTVPQPPVSEMIDKLRGIVAGRIEPDTQHPGPGSAAQKIGENLVEQGAVPQEVVDFALETQETEEEHKKIGEVLIDMKAATPKEVSQAIRPQAQQTAGAAVGGGQKPMGDQSIRIETAKLDALVDMVGELVIAQTLVDADSQVAADPKLSKDVSHVTKIVRDVQEVAMAMRMVPIGPTFQKMARLVRDVSRKASKQVNLIISGEDTELDKTVIQQIGDPLVHMVRNAVDHGIEPPPQRRAAGKPEVGEVHLSASHQGGNIVIEISDDGKGLDPKALIDKAIEKGIVQPGEELTDPQAYALVFAAGFSMAKEVTDISGRGVGMDVVKRNIDQLRGKVEITSEKGRGSTFSIRLPLTLAIIDGMIVRVGNERFIIPTITIEQSLRPLPEQMSTVQQRGEVLNVRGRLIPLVQLGTLFGLTDRINPCEAMVVIVHSDGRQIGLVVDELIGQQQVVIKTLGERFEQLRGISGAAILGDGKVGLILETFGLAEIHRTQIAPSCRAEQANRDTETDKDQIDEEANSTEHETSNAAVQAVPEFVGV